jgi:hypothetical protein
VLLEQCDVIVPIMAEQMLHWASGDSAELTIRLSQPYSFEDVRPLHGRRRGEVHRDDSLLYIFIPLFDIRRPGFGKRFDFSFRRVFPRESHMLAPLQAAQPFSRRSHAGHAPQP